jgi:hypothetical protein
MSWEVVLKEHDAPKRTKGKKVYFSDDDDELNPLRTTMTYSEKYWRDAIDTEIEEIKEKIESAYGDLKEWDGETIPDKYHVKQEKVSEEDRLKVTLAINKLIKLRYDLGTIQNKMRIPQRGD